jgi:hypothetical protein
METEQWRQSPSLPEYRVSSWGRVMRELFEGPMPNGCGVRKYGGKPHYGKRSVAAKGAKHGRMIFVFRGHSYKVHQLVCEAFHGPRPFSKAVVMHLDENSLNNRPENLAWGTQKQNQNAPGLRRYRASRTGENSASFIGRTELAIARRLEIQQRRLARAGRDNQHDHA